MLSKLFKRKEKNTEPLPLGYVVVVRFKLPKEDEYNGLLKERVLTLITKSISVEETARAWAENKRVLIHLYDGSATTLDMTGVKDLGFIPFYSNEEIQTFLKSNEDNGKVLGDGDIV